ncbi:MAG TPA: hypothetical protein DDW27_17330 [Bacteroidales bacterium]|nr:hypothetical protein [Bacteroidales bacterium]
MDITPFIRELLFSHDCVIVPGFGGFIGNYASSRIDKTTSTFYPPVKQISFNRNLKSNDGLLAGRISERMLINFNEAVNLIEEFVSAVRERIEEDEKVIFDNIGVFSNNNEGSIQFEPDRNVNYYPGSFGLESFQFSPAEGYDVRKRITRHIERDTERGYSTRVFLWRAAIIVPLVALATIVPLKTNLLRPRFETTTFNPLIKTEPEIGSNSKPESILVVPVKEEELPPAGSKSSEQIVSDLPGDNSGVPSEEGRFLLITGSFRLRENADQQAGILKEAGFNPEIITAANGFFRVSAMRCIDLSAAIEKKNDLEKRFPGTWVRKF